MTDLRLLFGELVRWEIELWNAVDARLRAECGLTLGRYEAMQVISRRSACRINDIADDLAITVGGTSKIVDRIEAAGHCRRTANPGDRRSSLIDLTPEGKRTLDRASVAVDDELVLRLGSVVPAAELEQFSRTLSTLRTAGHPASADTRTA